MRKLMLRVESGARVDEIPLVDESQCVTDKNFPFDQVVESLGELLSSGMSKFEGLGIKIEPKVL